MLTHRFLGVRAATQRRASVQNNRTLRADDTVQLRADIDCCSPGYLPEHLIPTLNQFRTGYTIDIAHTIRTLCAAEEFLSSEGV